MVAIKHVQHQVIARDPSGAHCYNQVTVRQLSNGEVLAVFNEERFPYHSDTGQTVSIRSTDRGQTWDDPALVLPWTPTTGNWDSGLCELADGTLLVNLTMCGYFKRGIKPEQPSWSSEPMTEEWGDWTWAYRTAGWLGTFVLRSHDQGHTWGDPIPVNVRPLKHAGCRLGCWQLPDGPVLMGVYGRIRGYGEEGEYESTRSALIRSDDNGENWEYYSTLAFDAASIVDYEEPALLRLKDGRLICMLRTHVNPSGDAKNLVLVVSQDDGFSWSRPRWTNIWGYPAELIQLQDGRVLMIYGYRRPPYGVRGCISEDGLQWDVANEFVIREGGVPAGPEGGGATAGVPSVATGLKQTVDWYNPGVFQHIGYPSAVQLDTGEILCLYHEFAEGEGMPLQVILSTRFALGD
jgi:hypothetical protein